MGSFVAWVDYSATEQERMRQALALFKETETRDELGLGAIRDALADIMFPGTSTVQTRLRYFLIVPWIYQGLPRSTTSARIGTLVDGAERDLIEVLADEPGAFGALSGRSLQRLPSSVYWNGLMTWGIFRLSLSQWEYHERWDAIRQHNQHVLIPDDGGVAPDLRVAWDPRMPDAPPDWRSSLSMTMQREESVYLRDRMESCGGSLLAHFALTRPRLDVRTPWDAVDRLPARLARMMRNARGFSTLVRGAALLYNLQLCRVSQLDAHRDRIPDYEKSMEQWAAEMAQVEEWSPDELWSFLGESGVPVPIVRGDRIFVDKWFDLVRRQGARALAQDAESRKLVMGRECDVKGLSRARFANPNALARWGGESGTGVMDFRWFRVRTLLEDLYAGLDLGRGQEG